ncbi:Nudix family hydrolase [Exilibacterium tricleocarpae]|uniref:8-oxo-dGTP diphosphatase n=1 Tax=Exilibacterium tricleocarpae TaxID=2591008 RepID=A0A545TQD5_9GAMM|nr:Nudix family hydrolase [Exilibacterium tricleocarpae]TQV79434.1 Nudix family hydrolase [Exilibacterium tricleocarpae]
MKVVHVAAGVIVNGRGEVLIAKRPDHTHQGGLWEFPGGKVEAGESVPAALARELLEELAIEVTHSRPLICIRHDYADKSVLLDVWKVTGFSGEPQGNEGQPVAWVGADQLLDFAFPAANVPIVAAARLSDRMAITGAAASVEDYVEKVGRAIDRGATIVQVRAHQLDDATYVEVAKAVAALCRRRGVVAIANTVPGLYQQTGCHGLHVTSERLKGLSERPVSQQAWFSASCHSPEQLRKAEALGVDFVTLSPVFKTTTHPEVEPLGWSQFQEWVSQAKVPVFALGGVDAEKLKQSFDCGAQGIAGIRDFWEGDCC